MKTKGKISFKNVTIPSRNKEIAPTVIADVEIEYEASYSVGEVIQALNILDVLPDKLAGAYRKFLEYQKEFDNVVIFDRNKNTCSAEDIVKDIIADMLKHEVEQATAAAKTEEE